MFLLETSHSTLGPAQTNVATFFEMAMTKSKCKGRIRRVSFVDAGGFVCVFVPVSCLCWIYCFSLSNCSLKCWEQYPPRILDLSQLSRLHFEYPQCLRHNPFCLTILVQSLILHMVFHCIQYLTSFCWNTINKLEWSNEI